MQGCKSSSSVTYLIENMGFGFQALSSVFYWRAIRFVHCPSVNGPLIVGVKVFSFFLQSCIARITAWEMVSKPGKGCEKISRYRDG